MVKEGTPCLGQEKGRNVILNEGFPWKEKAEDKTKRKETKKGVLG